jgi:hypothetical protein
VRRSVDCPLGDVEADDLVVDGDRLSDEGVEHAGGDPLVTAGPDGGVGHLVPAETLAALPAGPGDTGITSKQSPSGILGR